VYLFIVSFKGTKYIRHIIVNLTLLCFKSKPNASQPKGINPEQYAIHIVNPEEILFCKSSDGYTTVYVLSGKQYLLSKPLTKFSKELKSPFFIRVHQSYLININYLLQINKKEKIVILKSGFSVPFTISIKKLISDMQIAIG
jgi:DNA-binding LytR/AlgR family response regulator